MNSEFKNILDPISKSVGESNKNTDKLAEYASSDSVQQSVPIVSRKRSKSKGFPLVYLMVLPILLVALYFALNHFGIRLPDLKFPSFQNKLDNLTPISQKSESDQSLRLDQ